MEKATRKFSGMAKTYPDKGVGYTDMYNSCKTCAFHCWYSTPQLKNKFRNNSITTTPGMASQLFYSQSFLSITRGPFFF